MLKVQKKAMNAKPTVIFIFFYLIINTIKNNSKIITKIFAYMNNSIYICITLKTSNYNLKLKKNGTI